VQKLLAEQRESLGITEEALRKRLHEAKLLAAVDTKRGRLTVRRTIVGQPGKEVLFVAHNFLGETKGLD
jgi:hypothetical protein